MGGDICDVGLISTGRCSDARRHRRYDADAFIKALADRQITRSFLPTPAARLHCRVTSLSMASATSSSASSTNSSTFALSQHVTTSSLEIFSLASI